MVLVIVAHPDDEILTCGAYVNYMVQREEVYVVSMTKGSNIPEEQQMRTNAFIKACKCIGIKDTCTNILELPDQGLQSIPQIDLNKRIETIIENCSPELIITHTGNDLNTDHVAVNKSIKVATRQKNIKVIFFETMYPDVNNGELLNFYFNADRYFDKKNEALKYYRSFLRNGYDLRTSEAVNCLGRLRGHYIGTRYAEAFTIYNSVDMGTN